MARERWGCMRASRDESPVECGARELRGAFFGDRGREMVHIAETGRLTARHILAADGRPRTAFGNAKASFSKATSVRCTTGLERLEGLSQKRNRSEEGVGRRGSSIMPKAVEEMRQGGQEEDDGTSWSENEQHCPGATSQHKETNDGDVIRHVSSIHPNKQTDGKGNNI